LDIKRSNAEKDLSGKVSLNSEKNDIVDKKAEQFAKNKSENSLSFGSYENDIAPDYIPPEMQFFEDDLSDVLEKKRVNLNVLKKEGDLSARKLWGILTVKLREKNYVTLHTACGEIRDVWQEGNTIFAGVYEDYLLSILTNEANFAKILFEIKEIDDKLSLEFVYKKTNRAVAKENLDSLKKLFGDSLKIV